MNKVHSSRIDLNLLEVFAAVAETRSTTRAADRLALSQSAVSHALGRLRFVVGDPLFVRGRGRLEVTPHAAAMIEPARNLLESARILLRPPAFDPARTTRRFNIGASDYAVLTIVPALIRRMRTAAPDATVDVHALGGAVLAQLETGELDVAFVGAEPPPAPFRAAELFRERFVGVICARHPLALVAGQGRMTLDDYLAYPHALVTFRDPRLSPVDVALARLGRSRRVALVTPNFASNVASLMGTDLVMSIPARLADGVERTDLVKFELPVAVPDYPYSVVWHGRTEKDLAGSWLRTLIIRESAR